MIDHPVVLLYLLYEGGSRKLIANEPRLDVVVWRESEESYDLDDEDLPFNSLVEYPNFEIFWEEFTESAHWYGGYPEYVHPVLHERISQSLSELKSDSYKYQSTMANWRKALHKPEN